MTTHCGALILKKNQNLLLDYLYSYLSENLKKHSKGSQNKRVTIDVIKDIEFKVPIIKEGEFDLQKQKELAKQYQHIREIRTIVEADKQKINDLVIDVE